MALEWAAVRLDDRVHELYFAKPGDGPQNGTVVAHGNEGIEVQWDGGELARFEPTELVFLGEGDLVPARGADGLLVRKPGTFYILAWDIDDKTGDATEIVMESVTFTALAAAVVLGQALLADDHFPIVEVREVGETEDAGDDTVWPEEAPSWTSGTTTRERNVILSLVWPHQRVLAAGVALDQPYFEEAPQRIGREWSALADQNERGDDLTLTLDWSTNLFAEICDALEYGALGWEHDLGVVRGDRPDLSDEDIHTYKCYAETAECLKQTRLALVDFHRHLAAIHEAAATGRESDRI